MRDSTFFLRFFYVGVGALSILIFAPSPVDAGLVEVVKEWFVRQAPTTIVIDDPHSDAAALSDAHGGEPRETIVHATVDDTLTTRAMVDLSATDALWNEQEGSFTMVDETGVWMTGDGKDAGEDILTREHDATDVALAYDRDGRPIAVWTGAAHVYVSQWRDDTWRARGADAAWEEVAQRAMACDDAAACRVASPQVIMDGDDMPIVAWVGMQGDTQTVFVVRWNGTQWAALHGADVADRVVSAQGTDDAVRMSVHMTRDGARRPALVVVSGAPAQAVFTHWNGMQWVTANGDAGHDTLFAVSADDAVRRVHVHYDVHADAPAVTALMASGTVKHVVWRDRQWQSLADIAVAADDTVVDVAMAYDAQHAPVVAMIVQHADTTELRMQWWDQQQWKTYTMPLTRGERAVRLQLDEPMPMVVCYGGTERQSVMTGGVWTGVEIITMDAAAPGMDEIATMRGVIQHVAIIHSADGTPAVAWTAEGNLYTARWNGMQWTAMDRMASGEERIATGGVGAFAFAATPDGAPALLWAQALRSERRVQYAFVPTVVQSPRTVQSQDISGATAGIVSATVTADADVPDGARIVYAVSADNGATWHRARKKDTVVFDTPGNSLRWRAQLYEGDDHRLPTLYGVRVTYDVQQTVDEGVCGGAAREYGVRETAFADTLCAQGAVDSAPQFPAAGESVQWQCQGGVRTAVCSATHAADTRRTSTRQTESTRETSSQSATRGSASTPVADDRCTVETVSGISATTATLRVAAGRAYSGTEMKFKVEAENSTTGEQVFAKLYGTPSSDGRVQVTMDGLQPRTAYRVKVKMLTDGMYAFCPTVRTITTSAQ